MTSVQQFAKLPHRYGNSHATQCYLPPGRGDIPAPFPRPKLVLDLATPEGCKAELTQLAGCIPRWHTRPKTVTHPSTNRARRWLTSFMRRTPLTTAPRHRQHNSNMRVIFKLPGTITRVAATAAAACLKLFCGYSTAFYRAQGATNRCYSQ